MFFVPFWWWVLWSGARGGRRFSLRHLLARVVLSAILAEAVIGGTLWAMHGSRGAFLDALLPASWFVAAVAALTTVEPFVRAAYGTIASGIVATTILTFTSIGFRCWCAFACALGTLAVAPHVPALDRLLLGMQAQSGVYGTARFVVGATIAFLPIVFLAIWGLISLDGLPLRAPGPRPRPVQRRAPPPTYIPPPPPPPAARPRARIVSMTVDGTPQDPHRP